jgi:hypothetical protein
MIAFAVVLLVAVAVLVGYLLHRRRPDATPEIDAEQAMKAAVELHRIQRNLDAAWTKTEQRGESARMRRLLAEEMRDLD